MSRLTARAVLGFCCALAVVGTMMVFGQDASPDATTMPAGTAPAKKPWRNGVGMITGGEAAPVEKVVVGKPVEDREPKGEGQSPAFAGQTRAPGVVTTTPITVRVVVHHLRKPWALAFMPDGDMLINEKVGAIRVVKQDGTVGPEIAGVPAVHYQQDGGLMDLQLDPAFATNRMIYFSYVEEHGEENYTVIAKGRLSDDEKSLEKVEVIFRCEPLSNTPMHYGCRMLFSKDGYLFATFGERFYPPLKNQAQQLDSYMGKILRLTTDGKAAPGNPFEKTPGAKPEIWTYGHRNPQGLTFHPVTGELWSSEHGPQGGDELNIIEPGKNYGWPLIAYGIDYDGQPINGGKTQLPGMEQPAYYWDPAIAPSGSTFYTGDLIPEWKNNLFVCSLVGQHLDRLVIEGHKVVGEERLLQDQEQRMRDVVNGPDGALWVVTDDMDDGRLIRISARK